MTARGRRPTPKVLAALAQECVRATFFLIGKPASEHPDLVRRIAAEGHTHRPSHLARIAASMQNPASNAESEIDQRHCRGRNGASRGRDHDPEHAVLPLSRLSKCHTGDARPAAIARHRGVRRRPLGQRLGQMTPRQRIEAADRAAQGRRQGDHPAARSEGANRGHAAGFPALSDGQHYRVVHIVPAGPQRPVFGQVPVNPEIRSESDQLRRRSWPTNVQSVTSRSDNCENADVGFMSR